MPRPRRFTNAYGKFTKRNAGWESYTYKIGDIWYGPVDSTEPGPMETAVRLVPKKSDFTRPTDWGAIAERQSGTPYRYQSSYSGRRYEWAGENYAVANGCNAFVPSSLGSVSSSGTGVVVSLPSAVSGAAQNAARIKLKSQYVDLSVAFGEMRETINTLVDLIQRVGRSIRHARKGDFMRAIQALNAGRILNTKATASTYAMYVWALKPMMADMYGTQELIKAGFSRKGGFKVTGFASKSVAPGNCYLYPNSNWYRYSGSARCFCKVVYRARVHDEVLRALSQLGLANPFSTAWELLPLSFVVDWFLPIGDFLAALTAPLGTIFVSGFEDRVIETNTRVDYCKGGWPGFISGSTPHYSWQYFAFQRVTLTSFQPSALYIGGGLADSVSRGISIVALTRLRSQ